MDFYRQQNWYILSFSPFGCWKSKVYCNSTDTIAVKRRTTPHLKLYVRSYKNHLQVNPMNRFRVIMPLLNTKFGRWKPSNFELWELKPRICTQLMFYKMRDEYQRKRSHSWNFWAGSNRSYSHGIPINTEPNLCALENPPVSFIQGILDEIRDCMKLRCK